MEAMLPVPTSVLVIAAVLERQRYGHRQCDQDDDDHRLRGSQPCSECRHVALLVMVDHRRTAPNDGCYESTKMPRCHVIPGPKDTAQVNASLGVELLS